MSLDENENYSTNRRGMGLPNATSQSYGVERERGIDPRNIEEAHTTGTDFQSGGTSPGKLLGRLELLEKAFYGYVHGHQERLKTRLKESADLESVFTEELQVIKEGLRDLAQQQIEDDTE